MEEPLEGGIEAAVAAAQRADVVVLAVGEPQRYSGEAQSRVEITLPPAQQALAEARELDFNGFVMGVPEQMSGACAPVTRARMREVPPEADWHKVLPPDTLWDGVEGFSEVFTRGIANLPDTHICMLEFQAEYSYIGAENYFILHPADPPGAAEAIVPYGYDSIANTWKPMGYTLESGAVILTKLPEYTPYCFATTPAEGSKQSIKVFFQKVVWNGAIATVEGNMRVRQVAFPEIKTNQ